MDFWNILTVGLPVFIILLGPLMFIHELGHFLAAKRAGVRVEEFGMGLPPRLVRLFRRGETEYTLNWLPFGAFVRMTGEEDPSDPRSFAAQSKRWRVLILAAGPLMNLLGGFLILALAYLFFATQPTEFQYRIVRVNITGVGARLGLQPGDYIVSINGQDMIQRLPVGSEATPDAAPLRQFILSQAGQPVQITVMRPVREDSSELQMLTLNGTLPETLNPSAPLGIGLAFKVLRSERMYYTIDAALGAALADFFAVLNSIVSAPIEILSQQAPLSRVRPVGPVGITSIGVSLIEERESQGLFPFARFAGFVSIAIAFTNLLPLPSLDGGRLLFVLIEALRRRRVNPQREQWVHAVGMFFLLSLSVFIIILDILQPVVLP
ncbi:MAG: M50 family metallopeptidase [Thermoflexales bacterium]